ncbi:MAG: EAL domain-containing protein [Candidatus Thiodiazotropha sp. (ex Monitilora ramsayi)]|nr:EAL domain-containing protein [Candidatus Thiodiazotropha sp. (ex Monitilora ramsayi)]
MLRYLKDSSLYKQLIVPMFIVGFISVCVTVYSAFVLEDSVAALEKTYSVGYAKLRTLEEIETSLAYYRALSLRHLVSESSKSMEKIGSELSLTRQDIRNYIHRVSDKPSMQQVTSAPPVHVLKQMLESYFDNIDQALVLSADFEKESAFVLWSHVENDYMSGIQQSMQQLIRREFDDITSSRVSLMSAASRNLHTTIALGIVGGSLLLIIAFVVTRRITRRLSRLLDWSQMVAAGDLTAPLAVESSDEVGRLTKAMGTMANNIHHAHSELAEAKKEAEETANTLRIYANAFENSGEAILISDRENRIINVNAAFIRQTGFSHNEIIGKDPSILASGRTPKATYHEMWKALNDEGFWQGELWDRRKSGEIYPKWLSISAIRSKSNEVIFYIASFTDISEKKSAEEQIKHLAHHDILTGLSNRFSLEDRLEQSLASARREQKKVAVFFIDLDRFKNINDSLGHQVGDQLLLNVAIRLRNEIRESDIAARIGGDEFVVVLTGMTQTSNVASTAESIGKAISQPYDIDGKRLETSSSIGISVFPTDGNNADELLKSADVAMYHAKDLGPNNYHFFTESMLIAAKERAELERELWVALDTDQFELHYQPQIRTADNRICGLEALIRWRHPTHGLVSPGKFIPIAEETGFIHALGKWVLDEACRQLVRWRTNGISKISVAVNLSVKQLQSETLVELVRTIMADNNITTDELEFEITETAAMNEPELAVAQLHALRALGVRLAIDDFGTGYSSLAYLKRLPIQSLKLDRTFVHDIKHNDNDTEICAATLALAHNLGLEVVAEGVETNEQRDFLAAHNCDYLQGYLFCKPMPAEDITRFIKEHKAYHSQGRTAIQEHM